MNRALSPLLLLSLPLIAGNVRVDLPGGSGGTDDQLTYFNGSPQWVSWDGVYRGTWFNTEDFVAGSPGFGVIDVEYWFYESPNADPWDTDNFYSEVWNGGQSGPQVRLAQSIATASHYAPCFHCFDPSLGVEQNFWALINTEMSVGGWPSILGDDSTPGDAGHSFYLDGVALEIWELGEYYIGVSGWPNYSLGAITWGSLKALY